MARCPGSHPGRIILHRVPCLGKSVGMGKVAGSMGGYPLGLLGERAKSPRSVVFRSSVLAPEKEK